MKRMQNTALFRKGLALILALLTGVSFMPLLGGAAYAAETSPTQSEAAAAETPAEPAATEADTQDPAAPDITVEEVTDLPDIDLTDQAGEAEAAGEPDAAVLTDIPDADEQEDADGQAAVIEAAEAPADADAAAGDADEDNAQPAALEGSEPIEETMDAPAPEAPDLTKAVKKGVSYTVTTRDATGITNVRGSIASAGLAGTGLVYHSVYVDDYFVTSLSNTTSFNININMKNYAVGYHTIRVYLYHPTEGLFYDDCKYIPTYIYGRPGNSAGSYQVYSKYMDYNSGTNSYSLDRSCSLYMQYRKGSGKWYTCGPMAAYTTYKKAGLTPNKKYQTRLYYAKSVTYNGRNYVFSGLPRGYVSKIVTVKTGKNKIPPIKSVTVKATKVKKHKIRHYGYYTGVYLYTEIYYTYKLKITVKMKKKPAAKGLNICGKNVKGNKKKYTATFGTFTSTSKPRGKKATVTVYSYQSKTYGGYSKLYKKSKKVK